MGVLSICMFEAVYATPIGTSTLSRMAATASDHGFSGIIAREQNMDSLNPDLQTISNEFEIKVFSGFEINEKNLSTLSGKINSNRNKTPLLCVRGGDAPTNLFISKQKNVDVLCHSLRNENNMSHVMAKEAAKNNVRLEVNLSDLLRGSGKNRIKSLHRLKKQWNIISAYNVPFVVSSNPTSHLELRSPRELMEVGRLIGMTPEDIETGLLEWGIILSKNIDNLSGIYANMGVKRGKYGDSN
tara:strand:- start:521 stop:1246 length:726 start_codon:yes stop_codon:yes gene_type:complete